MKDLLSELAIFRATNKVFGNEFNKPPSFVIERILYSIVRNKCTILGIISITLSGK